jgi:hypothetical protein
VDHRVFRRGGFWVLLIDRTGDRATERTGGAVFERLKKGKIDEPWWVSAGDGFWQIHLLYHATITQNGYLKILCNARCLPIIARFRQIYKEFQIIQSRSYF